MFKSKTISSMVRPVLTLACAFAILIPGAAMADEKGISDAWIDGRLEATYFFNPHLSSFDIETEVEHGVVHLRGMVETPLEREFAQEIALGLDGVKEVRNDLKVAENARRSESKSEKGFFSFVRDATLTASVKMALLSSDSVGGLDINVDTEGGTVTLKGDVESAAERALAEKLARNTDGVEEVRNELRINKS